MNWSSSQQVIFPITIVVSIILGIAIYYLLKDKSEKAKELPFKIISAVCILGEITKQIYYIVRGTYTAWYLPFHFCSMFLVWFALAAFGKGKVKKVGYQMSFITSVGLFLALMITPSTILLNSTDVLGQVNWDNFHQLHSFYYHFLVCFFGFLIPLLKRPIPTIKDFKALIVPLYAWLITGSIMANIFNTNYANLLIGDDMGPIDILRTDYHYLLYMVAVMGLYTLAMVIVLGVITMVKEVNVCRLKKKTKSA